MKWQIKLVGMFLAASASITAFADGRSAAHNLFTNLSRAHASLSVNEGTALVGPTLVKGIYSLSNQQGRFIGFTNEAGTIFGDSRGFNVLSPNGAQPRQMALDEANDLRAEVLSAVEYEKLAKVTIGDGGGRRLLMFSAVDCPFCKGFEDALRKNSKGLDTTIYVVPSSLQAISQGGYQQWQAVSRIWCADNPGAAWQAYWASHAVPAPTQCRFADPRVAENADQQLKDILQAVGLRIVGTPQLIREDAAIVGNKPAMDAAYIKATFGPAGAPQVASKPARWLFASSDDSFQMQPVGAAPVAQPVPQPVQAQQQAQSQQQRQKFTVNDAMNIKKLFYK
jgi:hypothetical protein